jgi:hypothetical protein
MKDLKSVYRCRYLMIKKTTTLKKKPLRIPNALNAASLERNACGVMSRMQTHTPTAQTRLMSLEDRRLMIRTIKGMFHKGIRTAATSDS